MPAFDDILALEERRQELERELATKLDAVRRYSRRVIDAKAEVEKIAQYLKVTIQHIHRMKTEYPVVLLSEYERSLKVKANNEELLKEKRHDITRMTAQGESNARDSKIIAAQLKQVERELAGFGQVIQFRR